MDLQSKIYIAGHTGLVGSALVRVFKSSGYDNLITASRAELDLMDQRQVSRFFRERRPEVVIVAAGRVGGILANDTEPASFIYDNAVIATNLIHTAYEAKVTKLLYLGSSCIYPKTAASPIREDALLSGVLEPTNQWYAIAKILGIKLCQAYRQQYGCDFIAAMPTNLYGPNDRYSATHSHVLPALLDRFHLAKSKRQAKVVCWGTGTPRREFLYADDLADACLTLLRTTQKKTLSTSATEKTSLYGPWPSPFKKPSATKERSSGIGANPMEPIANFSIAAKSALWDGVQAPHSRQDSTRHIRIISSDCESASNEKRIRQPPIRVHFFPS